MNVSFTFRRSNNSGLAYGIDMQYSMLVNKMIGHRLGTQPRSNRIPNIHVHDIALTVRWKEQ